MIRRLVAWSSRLPPAGGVRPETDRIETMAFPRTNELGVSKTDIARSTGVSRATLHSFMSTRGLKPSPQRVFLHESGRYPFMSSTTRPP